MANRRPFSPSSTSPRLHRTHGRLQPPEQHRSGHWTPSDPSHDARPHQRAAPMTIGSRRQATAAPPPLPPPTRVPDIEAGRDLGWHFGNRSNAYAAVVVDPRSTLHGGDWDVRDQREPEQQPFQYSRRQSDADMSHSPTSPKFNEAFHERPYEGPPSAFSGSATSSHLHGERNLQRQNRKDSSHAYDLHLLSSLGGPRTPLRSPIAGSADGSPTSRRPSVQSPRVPPLNGLSISERSLSVSSDGLSKLNSPLLSSKWAASPQSQTGLISPGQMSVSASTRSYADPSAIFEESGSISSSMSSMPTREEFDRIGLRVPVAGPRSKGSASGLSMAVREAAGNGSLAAGACGGSSSSSGHHHHHHHNHHNHHHSHPDHPESAVVAGAPPTISRNPMGPSGWTIHTHRDANATHPAPPPGGTPTTATAFAAFSSTATSPYSPYATPSSNHADPTHAHLHPRAIQHHHPSQLPSLNSPAHRAAPGGGVGGGPGHGVSYEAATANPASLGGTRLLAFDDRRGPFNPHRHRQPAPLYLSTEPQPQVFLDERPSPSSPATAAPHHTQLPLHHRRGSPSRRIMSARKRSAAEISGASLEPAAVKSEDADRLTTRKPHRQPSPSSPGAAAQAAFAAAGSVSNGSYPPATAMSLDSDLMGSSSMLSPANVSAHAELPEERVLMALDPGLLPNPAAAPTHLTDVARQAAAAVQNEADGIHQLQQTAAGVTRTGGAHVCDCCPKKPKKFATAQELLQHQNEKQYTCQYCHNRFKNKNEAERHQNSLHLRRHSWSCAALDRNIHAAFHAANAVPPNTSASQAQQQQQQQQPPGLENFDLCGYCGHPFPNEPSPDWLARSQHLTTMHKFGECNQSKKFFRADHFRQHLKHSHNGKAGKWTNMLETACMREEPPLTPEAQTQEQLRMQLPPQPHAAAQQQHAPPPQGSSPGQLGAAMGLGSGASQTQQAQPEAQQDPGAQFRAQAAQLAAAQLAATQVISEHQLQRSGNNTASVLSLKDSGAPVAMMGQQPGYPQQPNDPAMQFRGPEGQDLKSEH